MATKNIVPRADSEGQLGTALKKWGKVIADEVIVGTTTITPEADVTGPGSVTPGHIATFADASGKILADGGVPSTGGGGSTFTFTQATPLQVWMITHNLGLFPSVTIVDSAKTIVEGDITYIDDNTVQASFSGAFSGTAYLN